MHAHVHVHVHAHVHVHVHVACACACAWYKCSGHSERGGLLAPVGAAYPLGALVEGLVRG